MQLMMPVNVFSTFVTCCVMSQHTPCSIENTDLHMVQNNFSTSSASCRKGNSNFNCRAPSFGHFENNLGITVH